MEYFKVAGIRMRTLNANNEVMDIDEIQSDDINAEI